MRLLAQFLHIDAPAAAVICVAIACITICATITISNILDHTRRR